MTPENRQGLRRLPWLAAAASIASAILLGAACEPEERPSPDDTPATATAAATTVPTTVTPSPTSTPMTPPIVRPAETPTPRVVRDPQQRGSPGAVIDVTRGTSTFEWLADWPIIPARTPTAYRAYRDNLPVLVSFDGRVLGAADWHVEGSRDGKVRVVPDFGPNGLLKWKVLVDGRLVRDLPPVWAVRVSDDGRRIAYLDKGLEDSYGNYYFWVMIRDLVRDEDLPVERVWACRCELDLSLSWAGDRHLLFSSFGQRPRTYEDYARYVLDVDTMTTRKVTARRLPDWWLPDTTGARLVLWDENRLVRLSDGETVLDFNALLSARTFCGPGTAYDCQFVVGVKSIAYFAALRGTVLHGIAAVRWSDATVVETSSLAATPWRSWEWRFATFDGRPVTAYHSTNAECAGWQISHPIRPAPLCVGGAADGGFSPDGRLFAYLTPARSWEPFDVVVVDLVSGQESLLLTMTEPRYDLRLGPAIATWDPTGRYLIVYFEAPGM